jgi:hypothetical protein
MHQKCCNCSTIATGDEIESAACDSGSISRTGKDRAFKMACLIGSAPSPNNSSDCTPCDKSKTTLTRQSVVCDICKPGYFQDHVVYSDVGKGVNTTILSFDCSPCPIGMYIT